MHSQSVVDKPPASQYMLDDLLSQIHGGQLKAGDKLLATAKLAEHYGVATPTAHHALTELVKQGYLLRRAGAGTFVQERSVPTGEQTIGLIMRCDGHIWADFTDRLLRQLRQLNVATRSVNTAGLELEAVLALPAFHHLMEDLPPTVIVHSTVLAEHILAESPRTRVISLDPEPGCRPLDQVAPDLLAVGSLAARHLIERGHERIDLAGIFRDFEGKYLPDFEARQLASGLNRELRKARLPLVQLVDIRAGDTADDHLEDYLASADRAPALVCSTSHRSAQIARLAGKIGLSMPDDLALVSGGETPWSEAYELTSIDRGYESMAELCAILIQESRSGIHERVPHRRSYLATPNLIQRQST